MNKFFNLVIDSEVIVCVGSGGVGKTTVASAIALQAAILGKKVLVLTIDPAQRLKTTMGISDSNEPTKISFPEVKGELWASLIDPKKTFDDFILRASKQSEKAKKILNNKLYIQLSTTLSGSQEFTALEKLYSAKESQKYDLIVLDTPPTKHAIDFLEAPEKLSALFQESIVKWFKVSSVGRQNFMVKILHAGTQKVLNALELLTGSDFMHELSEFFQSIEGWQEKLEKRINDVHGLLINEKTNFVLVSSLDDGKIKEAKYFMREIQKGGHQLSALIINRAFPFWMKQAAQPDISQLEKTMRNFYNQKSENLKSLDFQFGIVLKLPELEDNISDLSGVREIAGELEKC